MPRVKYEFNCTNCPAIFDVKLNINMRGNYRVHCPGCGHIHYRQIVNGKITDTRFDDNQNSILIDDIYPMASAIKEKSEEIKEDMEYCHSEKGFFHRLWADKLSGDIQIV